MRGPTAVREAEIRGALVATLRRAHPDPAETLIVEEFAVSRGEARVDVAAVNGLLAGFEIKSGSDTLARLPRQVEYFSRVMDEMTLICAPRHLARATELVPRWWGVSVADTSEISEVRRPQPNPAHDVVMTLLLLWRDELVSAARSVGLPRATRLTRSSLAEMLASTMNLPEIRSTVRAALKSREGWRSPQRPS